MTLFSVICCFDATTTFLFGSANADAQNARANTPLAHRADQPQRRLNLLLVFMPELLSRSEFYASLFEVHLGPKKDVSSRREYCCGQLASARHQSAQRKCSKRRRLRRAFASSLRVPLDAASFW
jgi:hypothetical protein